MAFGDLLFAWQIVLVCILVGWTYTHFGPGLLTAGISVVLVWAFVINAWGLFSILYLVMFFFMMQGLFFIQMIYSQRMGVKEQEKMQAEAMQQQTAMPPEFARQQQMDQEAMMRRMMMG